MSGGSRPENQDLAARASRAVRTASFVRIDRQGESYPRPAPVFGEDNEQSWPRPEAGEDGSDRRLGVKPAGRKARDVTGREPGARCNAVADLDAQGLRAKSCKRERSGVAPVTGARAGTSAPEKAG